jgi:hypothetical protein
MLSARMKKQLLRSDENRLLNSAWCGSADENADIFSNENVLTMDSSSVISFTQMLVRSTKRSESKPGKGVVAEEDCAAEILARQGIFQNRKFVET